MMLCFEKQDEKLAMSSMLYHDIHVGSGRVKILVYHDVRRATSWIVWDNTGDYVDRQVKENINALL